MPKLMDLRSFPEMAGDSKRLDVITGIIADYEMPNMKSSGIVHTNQRSS